MAGERRINFGADETDARYQIEDTGDGADFVLARDLDGGTVLLEYDSTAGEWVSRGPVNLSGNDVTNVGALDAASVSTKEVNSIQVETPHDASISDNSTVVLSNRFDSFDGIAKVTFGAGSIADTALFEIDSRAEDTRLVWSGNGSRWSTADDNDGTMNVYYSSGNARFELENKLGFGVDYSVSIEKRL